MLRGYNMRYLTSLNAKLILKLLYTNPDKKYYLQELARLIGKKAGVLQKAVNYLVKEKIVLDERKGNLRLLFINKTHPLYHEIQSIIFKTIGVEGGLREALKKIKNIRFAFIYGSFAKNTSDAISDIDLCIIGDVKMREIIRALSYEEKALQREINYVLYSPNEFKRKMTGNDPFITEILIGAVFLIGTYEKLISNT